MMYIAFVISTLLAGFIQGVSGFGAGIVFMSIIPYFLSVISSATISNFMSVFLNLMMSYHYRKSMKINLLLMPALFFILGGTISILFVTKINKYRVFKIGFRYFFDCTGSLFQFI